MKIIQGKNTITTQIAYIAGFFDGEGCVRIKKANQGGNSYYLIAHLTNTNQSILKMVQELFGGAIRKQEAGRNRPVYNWCVSSSEANDFLKTLLPFLMEKKTQAELGINFHESKEKMTPSQKQSIYQKMMSLKKEIIGNIYENPELLK